MEEACTQQIVFLTVLVAGGQGAGMVGSGDSLLPGGQIPARSSYRVRARRSSHFLSLSLIPS